MIRKKTKFRRNRSILCTHACWKKFKQRTIEKIKIKKKKRKSVYRNVRIIFVQFEMDLTHPSVVLGLVYEGHEVARRHHFGPFCRPIFARVHSTDRCPPCDETPASNHSRIPILWERCEQFEYDSNNHS